MRRCAEIISSHALTKRRPAATIFRKLSTVTLTQGTFIAAY